MSNAEATAEASTPEEPTQVEIREVSRDDVRKFALAIGTRNPVHFDIEAARDAGYPELLAPRFFFASLGLSFDRLKHRDDLGDEGLPLNDALSGRRVVAGETRVYWDGDIFAGDSITVTQRLLDRQRKLGRSGGFELLNFERTYRRGGILVVREVFSRIAR